MSPNSKHYSVHTNPTELRLSRNLILEQRKGSGFNVFWITKHCTVLEFEPLQRRTTHGTTIAARETQSNQSCDLHEHPTSSTITEYTSQTKTKNYTPEPTSN